MGIGWVRAVVPGSALGRLASEPAGELALEAGVDTKLGSPGLRGFGAGVGGEMAAFLVQAQQQGSITVTKARNFYGVLTVFERTEPWSGLRFAKLVHGRTAHGLQFKDAERAKWPTMYFSEKSGVGLALRQVAPGSRRSAWLDWGRHPGQLRAAWGHVAPV